MQDSSSEEDEQQGSKIHRAFDKIFSNEDGFPFTVGGSYASITSDHPSPIQIFQLWQIYIDNINSLLKITHVPTVQAQVLDATTRLDRAPKNIEALMFGIYCMAITSLEDSEVLKLFNEPKQTILVRFLASTQQALINANYMKVDDLLVLQAYVLYLVCPRQNVSYTLTLTFTYPLANVCPSSLLLDGSWILAKYSVLLALPCALRSAWAFTETLVVMDFLPLR